MGIASRVSLAVAALAAVLAAPPALAADRPHGVWLTEKKKVAVELFDCTRGLCGRIVWMAKPFDDDGTLRRDHKNPDKASRDRPWCGLGVIAGLEQTAPDTWSGGKFYYPKHGRSYDLEIAVAPGGLQVHAYAGVKFLGVTEAWERVEAAPGTCPDAARQQAQG